MSEGWRSSRGGVICGCPVTTTGHFLTLVPGSWPAFHVYLCGSSGG